MKNPGHDGTNQCADSIDGRGAKDIFDVGRAQQNFDVSNWEYPSGIGFSGYTGSEILVFYDVL
eukprot:scaffold2300_cov160-Amphora_coffeaeformis.AAC.8